jgi:hypothetical protein
VGARAAVSRWFLGRKLTLLIACRGMGGAEQPNICLTCTDLTTPLLTEGDLDRG